MHKIIGVHKDIGRKTPFICCCLANLVFSTNIVENRIGLVEQLAVHLELGKGGELKRQIGLHCWSVSTSDNVVLPFDISDSECGSQVISLAFKLK